MPEYEKYRQDLEICKKITNFHGKSYAFATLFFPKKVKEATYIIYAWMRTPDDWVDIELGKNKTETVNKLKKWNDDWYLAYHKQNSEDPILRAASFVFHTYKIPFEYSQDFLKAMNQDLIKKRYENYQELEDYMYGSAGVVGLIMSHIIGFKKEALPFAEKLGNAMQLTNFIRDLKDDYTERDRIYFPKTEMDKFNFTEKDIRENNFSLNFKSFIEFQINKTEKLYRESLQGIKLLNNYGQYPVYLALCLYREIGRNIKKDPSKILTTRVRTTKMQKIILAFKSLVNWKINNLN